MPQFEVQDMTCGHCVASVTRAVHALDAHATVTVDLPTHLVSIESARATAPALQAALEEAGYTPVPR